MPNSAVLSADWMPNREVRAHAEAVGRLLRMICDYVPQLQAHAGDLDTQAAFPTEDIACLRAFGVLLAPLSPAHGGLGLGTEAAGAAGLFDLLRLIGRGNLAVGRIIEGHVNALQLICRYGSEAQIARAAADAAQGHLFAIWNTEAPPGVRLDGQALTGRKHHVSAAGSATRPLITVDQHAGSRLLLVALRPGERATVGPQALHGMRTTRSGTIDFTGYRPGAMDWIGQAGAYLCEPVFSAGAWRSLAVMLGGITALVEQLRDQLRARGRAGNPHQAARLAETLIAQETAFLWTRKAALLAESSDTPPQDATAYVHLARRAVERAGLEAIQLAQRSLGLACLADGNPVERLVRDLATYLRQPALDEALEEAAAHFLDRSLPGDA